MRHSDLQKLGKPDFPGLPLYFGGVVCLGAVDTCLFSIRCYLLSSVLPAVSAAPCGVLVIIRGSRGVL